MKITEIKKRGRPRKKKRGEEIIRIVRENPPESGVIYITIRKKWLNATEASIYLDITKRHLYNLLKIGLPYKRKGGRYIFSVKDIDKWLKKGKKTQRIYKKEAFLTG
jgi:hypothetical protein